ncbi:PREDICTED: uncharacterized protein CXorf66 homolog [Hipposideros armiger]|uniref:Uncharacterized protein CXorf66 homolog n=1 Tax=Hipposideros armiger TaxID=186990 RepID=A0A8B7THX7_HIPAR|nr:PREDICTED: uncharacterized protein CXorf66 homolog [Hipposideros armiger]
MNIFICVLLLFIWTTSCLNRNQSDGSSTEGAKHLESMVTKVMNFRRHLLFVVIGGMIIAFGFSCFCFIHYNCLSDEAGMVRIESVAATSSRSSKISFRKSKGANPRVLEEQRMLLDTDRLSGPSSVGTSSRTSSMENLHKTLSPEMAPVRSNTEKLIRPSSQEKSSKPSSPKRVFSLPHLEEPHTTCSLDKLHELADSYKLLSQGSLSYPNIAIRSPFPANVQYPVRSTKPPCPPCPQNQTKSSRYCNIKNSVGKGVANMVSRPQLVKPYQCYQEDFLVSISMPESLANDISEPKKTNSPNLPFPHEVMPVSKSFHEADAKDDALYGNVNDSDMMTNDSDESSDGEITIICNVNLSDVIPKDTPK